MMDPARRQKLLIAAVAIAFAFLAADRMIITPLTATWSERSARIAELDLDIAKAEAAVEREDSLERRWKEMQQSSLPAIEPEAEGRVLRNIGRWAGECGVEVVTFKPRWVPGADEEEGVSKRIECRATGYGTLESIARFLYKLETQPEPLKVEQLTLTVQDGNAARLALDVTFSGLAIEEAAP